ncbi:MAG: hypothetical protein IH614_15935 [Desulfuromonadales bacterium]|nr:hypothetical protein [Desulfuromonadales bacterium]
MNGKEITVVFYGWRFPRSDWRYEVDESRLEELFRTLGEELGQFGIDLRRQHDPGTTLEVKGYADLLNCVRLRSPADHIGNLCLGHVIGSSPNLDLLEDIRRGINRVAFAPETIAPEDDHRRVCHNCGCGC